MSEEKRAKREYARFILLWIIFLVVIFLLPDSSGLVRYITLSIVGFGSLYTAAIFTPVFRSWKAASSFEGIPNAVEAYVEEREVVAEAKDMVDIISQIYYPSKGETQSKKRYPTKHDEIYDRLLRCADKHNKEAKRLEELSEHLISIRSKHYQEQKG